MCIVQFGGELNYVDRRGMATDGGSREWAKAVATNFNLQPFVLRSKLFIKSFIFL